MRGPHAAERGPRPSQVDLFPKVGAATTAEDGAFALTVHPGTTWTVSARPVDDNWRLSIQESGVAPGREDVLLTVTEAGLAGCVVAGSIVAADGLPGSFAISIVDYGADGTVVSSSDAGARWDGNRFECRPLALGQQFGIRVQEGEVRSARLAEAFFGPFRTDRARLDLTIRLEPWATLPVRVLETDGTPARRVRVGALEAVPTSFGRDAKPVDREGIVNLARLVPGELRLMVFDDAGKRHEQRVTILPGLNPEIVIRLPAK
jgi:hypothetical protein